jgi:endonuclease YncB( thermonuclease family)
MTHVASRARVPKKAFVVFAVVALLMILLAVMVMFRGMVQESRQMQIVEVVDGTTVKINAHGDEKTVKMAGIAAGPRNPDGLRVGPALCMGENSYVWLRDRLVQGATAEVDLQEVDGQEFATFRLAGEDINVAMVEEGIGAPTGIGVSAAVDAQMRTANEQAYTRNIGLYDLEERCTINSELYEAEYAMDVISDDVEPSITQIDEKAVELGQAVDQVRLVQEDIHNLDPQGEGFVNTVWGPAKEVLMQEADEIADRGMKRLRDLNDRRNEIYAR